MDDAMKDLEDVLVAAATAYARRLNEAAGPGLDEGEQRQNALLEAMEMSVIVTRISRYAKDHLVSQDGSVNEHMAAVYFTLCKHSLGSGYAPGGTADKYLIPQGYPYNS